MSNSSFQDGRQSEGGTERQASSMEPTTGLARDWAPTLDASGRVRSFDDYEAEIFRFALANAGGCVSRAAELLGVGRATMYRKMRAYSITAPPVSERAIDRTRRPSSATGHKGPPPGEGGTA